MYYSFSFSSSCSLYYYCYCYYYYHYYLYVYWSTVVFCETLFSTYLIRLLNLGCPRTDIKVINSKYLRHVDGKRSAAILMQNKMSDIMKKILREVTEPNKTV